MEQQIWKFPITKSESSTIEIEMPKGADVLTAQAQKTLPCIWAIVDPEAPKETRYFQLIFTGKSMPEFEEGKQRMYISSFQSDNGLIVYHLFEILDSIK